MKKSLTYILLLGAMLGTVSCDKQNDGSTFADPWEHFGGYMQFATGVNNGISITRGALVSDNQALRNTTFGVIGYAYSSTSSWRDALSTTAPMTEFYNQAVNVDGQGVCTYDATDEVGVNDVPWNVNNMYTFFAYAPRNANGISLSPNAAGGAPYIDYEYGWKDAAAGSSMDNPIMVPGNANIYDLMTARAIDVSGQSGRPIGLNFEHRLFGIEVLVNNYNENYFKLIDNGDGTYGFEYQWANNRAYGLKDYDAKYGPIQTDGKVGSYDPDGTGTEYELEYGYFFLPDPLKPGEYLAEPIERGGKPYRWGRREVTNLKIAARGLMYSETRLFTNPEEVADVPGGDMLGATVTDSEGKVVEGVKEITFQISATDQKVVIPAFDEVFDAGTQHERGGSVATSISYYGSPNHDGYLMFIPQEDSSVECVLSWDELVVQKDEENKPNNEFASAQMDFEAGRLYQVIINYIGESITVALIEAGKWTPHTVEYTFE